MEPHRSSLQKIQDVTSQSTYKRDTFLWKVLITNTIRSRNLQKKSHNQMYDHICFANQKEILLQEV
jgi:hypothetical protein